MYAALSDQTWTDYVYNPTEKYDTGGGATHTKQS